VRWRFNKGHCFVEDLAGCIEVACFLAEFPQADQGIRRTKAVTEAASHR
jgi:hypothetical protein